MLHTIICEIGKNDWFDIDGEHIINIFKYSCFHIFMINTLAIAPLLEDDMEELIKLVNSAYRGESSKKGWTTEADLLDGIRTDEKSIQAQIQRPGSVLLSAKDEAKRMVGCVYLMQQEDQLIKSLT